MQGYAWRYVVQEPTVVAHYDSTACKVLKTFLKRAECVDVNIIGRLIEKKYIPFLFELIARWRRLRSPPERTPIFFFLISTGEIEFAQVSAGVHVSCHPYGTTPLP